MDPASRLDLGITSRELPGGLHVCYLFGDDAERFQLIARFFEAGRKAGDKLFYVVDSMSPEQLRARIEHHSRELRPPAEWNVLRTSDGFYPDGAFSTEDMLARMRALLAQSAAEGFRGSRVVGEMSWILKGVQGAERAMEFEARVTSVLKEHPHSAGICQYDLHLFNGATLMDVLTVHPYTIVRGQFMENPFFIDAEEFLRTRAGRRLAEDGSARA
jgi:hypothetical protein